MRVAKLVRGSFLLFIKLGLESRSKAKAKPTGESAKELA